MLVEPPSSRLVGHIVCGLASSGNLQTKNSQAFSFGVLLRLQMPGMLSLRSRTDALLRYAADMAIIRLHFSLI